MTIMRNARSAVAALALVAMAACGGDSNDPTPFDPAAVTGDIGAAAGSVESAFTSDAGEGFQMVSDYLATLSAPAMPTARASMTMVRQSVAGQESWAAREQLLQATRAIAASRAAVTGSAIILPEEVLGTTFVWDALGGTYTESERTDAPEDGVRFVLYALDPVSHEPAEPLNELGYVDLRDLSTASVDIARLIVVSQGVTYFDYRVSASGTEDDADIDVAGFISDGDDRINFDLRNDFLFTASSSNLMLDYELEFSNVDVTLDYQIEITNSESSSRADFDASLRGPHGYLDMSGFEEQDDAGYTADLLFEVNGDEFAVVQCVPAGVCDITDPEGAPLTEDEAAAFESFYSFSQFGLLMSVQLMYPAGAFYPL